MAFFHADSLLSSPLSSERGREPRAPPTVAKYTKSKAGEALSTAAVCDVLTSSCHLS